MKKIAAALLASIALIGSAPVLAQNKASAAPAAKPAPVDPATAKAVRRLLDTMKFKEMMSMAFAQMTKSMPDMMHRMAADTIGKNNKMTPEQKKVALAKVDAAIPTSINRMNALFNDPGMINEMVEATVPIYARHFTVAEIDQITVFYQSGVGAKMLTLMPQLMEESMVISQKIMMPRLQRLMTETIENPTAK